MANFITAVGILFLVLGVVFVARPQIIRDVINFSKVGRRIYIGGVIRIVIGALLLLAMPSAKMPWVPGILGAVMLIAGTLIFVLGLQKVHAIIDWMYGQPDNRIRIAPVVVALIGILLIYSA